MRQAFQHGLVIGGALAGAMDVSRGACRRRGSR